MFELGQRVRYSRTLHRRYRDGQTKWEVDGQWADRVQHPEYNGEGIVIGLRSFSNGSVAYYEDHTQYTSEERFTVVVIVSSLRRKPVYVLPENVVPVQEPHDS